MYRASHCFTALMVMAMASSAFAAGYYNMPTSLQQCLGLGYGPGYHAPLMLEPSYKATTASQRVQRISAPLHPSQACDFSSASSWASSCEGGHCSGGRYSEGHCAGDAAGIYHGASNGYTPAIEAPAVEVPVVERVAPSFAPPALMMPQQVIVPLYPMQPMYPAQHGFPERQVPSRMGPVFPSAKAPQKPMLLW